MQRIFGNNNKKEDKKPLNPQTPQTDAKTTPVPYPLEPLTENSCPGCGMMGYRPASAPKP